MKIIFAIFAIAALAAFFVLLDDGAEMGDSTVPAMIEAASGDESPRGAWPVAGGSKPAAGGSLPAGGGSQKPGELDLLLRAASERLNRWESVSARLRYRIHLFGNELIGSGFYQQQGHGSARRLRLELKTEFGDQVASQVQVCDGQALWTYQDSGGKPQVTRLDLRRVRASQRQFMKADCRSSWKVSG